MLKTERAKLLQSTRNGPGDKYCVDSDIGRKITNASMTKTSVYTELLALQKIMVAVHIVLLPTLAVLVSETLHVSRAAEENGGDENALLHNMTVSLSAVSGVLCAMASAAMVSHNTGLMDRAMVFQALIAPCLIFCGVLLFESSAALAAGAVLAGVVTLIATYFINLQRQYEDLLQDVCLDDMVERWVRPTRKMHNAASIVQASFRTHLAVIRAIRAREFNTWLRECRGRRFLAYSLANAAIGTTIVCLMYSNLVFAAKFDSATSAGWLTTCVIAVLVEAFLQQPVVLLSTGVLGDFVEEGADILVEMLGL